MKQRPITAEKIEYYIYQSNGKCVPIKEEPDISSKNEGKFSSEEELVDMLKNNPELIEPNMILLESDPKGAGGIDILGLNSEGRFIVVEAKKVSITASSLGQCLGYALKIKNWPLSKLRYRYKDKLDDSEISKAEAFSKGKEFSVFPKIILVGNSIASTALQCIYLLRELKTPDFEIKAISINKWNDINGKIIVRICTHKPIDHLLRPWNSWKEGDIVHDTEWLDTGSEEDPVEIVKIDPDGIQVRSSKGKRIKKKRPFLANYISVKKAE